MIAPTPIVTPTPDADADADAATDVAHHWGNTREDRDKLSATTRRNRPMEEKKKKDK